MTKLTNKSRLRASFLALAALVAAGCAETITAAPLDSSKARDALKTTLEAWKRGDEPSALKSASPAITAQDLDWLAGSKLVSYEVKGEGTGVGSNLRVPVQVTLTDKDGKDVVKTVNYVVGTSPSLTVFRDVR